MIKKIVCLIFLCAVMSAHLFAQFYSVGYDPAGVKWRSITSENFQLIYPSEIDSLARVYLYNLEKYRPLTLESLEIDPSRMPVILHPYTTISNGSVAMAPTRIDLFTTPSPYSVQPEPWERQLAIHEVRHTGQDEHFTKGFYNCLGYVIGEQSYGVGLAFFAPSQYMEGDAVVSETVTGNSGRGRNAGFVQYLRALTLSGEYRNYKQFLFGSSKYNTPDKYVLGYMTNNGGRMMTGDYFFSASYFRYLADFKVQMKDLFKKDGLTFPLIDTYYDYGLSLFSDFWTMDNKSRGEFTDSMELSHKRNRLYTDYSGAIIINDPASEINGEVITVKSGMQHPKELISIDDSGNERHLSYFSYYASNLSIPSGGRIYWSETVTRNSAKLEDYSIVRYYDYFNCVTKDLTSDTRYFNPQPNAAGTAIAVAEYPVQGGSCLVILTSDGEVASRVVAPDGWQIVESAFIGDDVYCSVVRDDGIGIYKWDGADWSVVLPGQYQSIESLKSVDGTLYFTSDSDGLNNIWQYDPSLEEPVKLTNSQYGVNFPYIDSENGFLYLSEFDKDGYHISKMRLDDCAGDVSDFYEPAQYPFVDELLSQADAQSSAVANGDAQKYLDADLTPSKRYGKFGHMFHIHSWAPLYYNIDNIMAANFDQFYSVVAPGATLYSQNELGNVVTMLGYSYHDHRNAGHFKMTADVLNLTVEVATDYNDRAVRRYEADTSILLSKPLLSTGLRLYKPVNFSKGGWVRRLTPQVELKFTNDEYQSSKIATLKYGLTYSHTLHITKNQVFPRWGFGVSALLSTAYGRADVNSLGYAYLYAYLPGVLRSQGLKLTSSLQWRGTEEGAFALNSIASMPRGYKEITPNDGYLKFTADYAIPVYLGDVDCGLFYLRRLQLIPFADYAIDSKRNVRTDCFSYGFDAMLDFNVLQISQAIIKMGVRYSRTPLLSDRNNFELLFSIDM